MGDVSTCCGSMISHILEQQQVISAFIADEQKYWHKMPNDAEFTTLETVYDVLKPLSTLTDALAGENKLLHQQLFQY